MLSLRLKTVAALVPSGARVCDIGTDHARLPIYLIQSGIAKNVIAADLREKPLEKARENIRLAGVLGIDTRLCNGFDGIGAEEFDAAVIAGIGGEVISGIIDRADILKNTDKLLILQPTTSPEILRRFLCENGFMAEKEIPVFDNGKLYSVMAVRFSGKTKEYAEAYYYIGSISPDTPAGAMYIKKQYNRITKCAKALEDIPEKVREYEYYNNLSEELGRILNGV